METTSIKQKNQLNYYMQVTEYRKCNFVKGYYLYYNSIKIIKCLSICSLSAVSGCLGHRSSTKLLGCSGQFLPAVSAPFPCLHRCLSSVGLKGAQAR